LYICENIFYSKFKHLSLVIYVLKVEVKFEYSKNKSGQFKYKIDLRVWKYYPKLIIVNIFQNNFSKTFQPQWAFVTLV